MREVAATLLSRDFGCSRFLLLPQAHAKPGKVASTKNHPAPQRSARRAAGETCHHLTCM